MWAAILGVLSTLLQSIFTLIINTPRHTYEVKEVTNGLKIEPTSDDVLLDKYIVHEDEHKDRLL